ncbi:MAG TPA: hypothetical protein VK879_22230 [Candidatus Sulfomarinibacteraceae bacterium]|nr:hypothetical protein [Candidatus Sulfomarinibacteraceae bacterium]
MAVVTVVNGSPHPEGYTSDLVERIVEGIEAGGSGNGMVLAVRALHSFFGWGWRPLPPLPVSRFNYEHALETAEGRGRQMAEAAQAEEKREEVQEALARARRLAGRDDLEAAADDIAIVYECGRAVWRGVK